MNVKDVYKQGFAITADYTKDPRLMKVLQIIKEEKIIGRKLLDMGCGDGIYTAALAKAIEAKEFFGFDISEIAVARAKKNGVHAMRQDIDLVDLSYRNNFFDFIFCGNLIELILNADHLLSEANRVLKPEGYFIVTFPNVASWGSRLALLLGYLPYFSRVSTKFDLGKMGLPTKKGDSTGFIRLFTLGSFRELAERYHFSIETVHGVPARFLPFPLTLIDKIISKSPSLAFQIVCVLRKRGEK